MKNRFLIFLFLFLLFEVLVFNDKISLWDQDEAAYAAFAKQMIETKNFVVPQYTWSEIHRKPPLHFWLIALSYKIWGVNEFAVRFFVALAVWGTFLLLYFYGKKFWGEKIAIYSVLILAGSFFVPLLGKIALTDGLLLFFYTLVAFSLFSVLLYRDKKQIFIFWIAIAFGLLVKGPPIAIFAGFLFVFAFIFSENRKNLILLHPWFYGWLSLIPLLAWGYFAWQADNGKFITWLIDWYVLRRVNSSVLGQTGPVGYYFATFILFFLPFLTLFFSAFVNAFKSFKEKNEYFLPALWLISGWLVYEFLKSKLPSYALAAHPAIAIILAMEFDNVVNKKQINFIHKISALLQLVLVSSMAIAWFYFKKSFDIHIKYASLIFVFWVLMTAFLVINVFLKKKNKFFASALLLNGLIFMILSFTLILPQLDNYKNATKKVALYIKDNSSEDCKVVIQNDMGKPPSLPFYIENLAGKEFLLEKNTDRLLHLFASEENYIFVVDKKTKDIFVKKFCPIAYREITSYSTDRKSKKQYFIIKNHYQ